MIFMEMIPMEIAIDVLNNFSFHYIFLMVDQNVNVGTLYVVISVYIYCLFINFSEKIFKRQFSNGQYFIFRIFAPSPR